MFSPVNSTASMRGCSSMMNETIGEYMMGGQQSSDSGCSNMMIVNFTATTTTDTTYSISGMVTLPGTGMMDIRISRCYCYLTGAGSGTTTTTETGMFAFNGLTSDDYTITPGKSGYTFTPVSSAQIVRGNDMTGVSFTAATN